MSSAGSSAALSPFSEGEKASQSHSKGRRYLSSPGGIAADLMFLHVAPEHEGRGIGSALVEETKMSVTPGIPIKLKCEGMQRKEFFVRLNFEVTEYWDDGDLYEMQWNPPTPDAA